MPTHAPVQSRNSDALTEDHADALLSYLDDLQSELDEARGGEFVVEISPDPKNVVRHVRVFAPFERKFIANVLRLRALAQLGGRAEKWAGLILRACEPEERGRIEFRVERSGRKNKRLVTISISMRTVE